MKILGLAFFLLVVIQTANGQTYFGDALDFDGVDDYVEIDSNLTFAAMTVEAWVYNDNWADATNDAVIIGNYNTDGWRIYMEDSIEINIYDGDTQVDLQWDDDALTGWNHIAFSISAADDLRLYINGEEVATDLTITTSLESDVSVNTIIGAQVDDTDGAGADTLFYEGKIDEVRIWSTVRDPDSINTYMYVELDGTESNLEAYYKMSDGSGTSLTDNDNEALNGGTLNNMDDADWVVSTAFSANDNALDFDGSNDYVKIDNNFDATNYTIEFWFNQTGGSVVTPIFSSYDGTGGIEIGFTDINPPLLDARFIDQGAKVVDAYMSDGWNHVAITKSATEVLLYLNGVLEDNHTIVLSYTSPTADSSVFCAGTFSTNYFQGQVDEFRAWNVVRTASEIREYMCRTIDPGTTGLVAYLNFNHNGTSSVYDITGNGNNGTLTDMDAANDWISSSAYNTWLGESSTSWSDADNWSLGAAPTSAHNIGLYSYNAGNSATINDSRTVRNLVVGSSATVTVSSDFSTDENAIFESDITLTTSSTTYSIGNNLAVGSSATVTLEDSTYTTVTGDTHNDGTILLKSPANMGAAASIITTDSIINNGTMQAERFVTFGTEDADNYNWHMMTPVIGSFTAQTYFNGDYVYSFDESADTDGGAVAWVNINTDSVMSPGTGYIVKTLTSDKTYTYSGTFNDGEISLDLTRTDDTDDQGFNLVGNPYPSPIDWNAASGWTKTNIGSDIWIWNPADTLYAVWDGTTSTNDGSRYIYPGQAFYVQVNTGQTSGTLTMDDNVRVHSTGSVSFKSADNEPLNLIKLALIDGQSRDEWAAYISDKPNTTTKFFSWNSNRSQIYSYLSDSEKPLAIQKVDELDTIQIPLGIKAIDGKKLRIEILENSFNTNKYELFLKDGESFTPLSDIESSGYSFTHDAINASERLSLFFKKYSVTGIENNLTHLPNHVKLLNTQTGIELQSTTLGDKFVRIFDISGREIRNESFYGQSIQISLPKNGLYILYVNEPEGVYVKKFVY